MEKLAESFVDLERAFYTFNESLDNLYWAFAEAGVCPIFCEGIAVELLRDGND